MNLSRRNAYFCSSCRRVTITVEVDAGVTPMFISCPHCSTQAASFMYELPGCMRFTFVSGTIAEVPADFEWYKPDKAELKKLPKSTRDHVKAGGLLMRKRTDKEPIMLEPITKNNRL